MADYETLLSDMDDLQRNPINLNTAATEEFEKLIFLTDFQISSLEDYRSEHGILLMYTTWRCLWITMKQYE